MSLDGTYDDSNVFAKILRSEIPGVVVFEDAEVLVLMDAFPQASGHMLAISKTSKARDLLEAEPKTLGRLIGGVQKAARAVKSALKPDGVIVSQFNGASAGQTVFHLHFHIIPRYEGEGLSPHGGGIADPAELKALAARIAAALPV